MVEAAAETGVAGGRDLLEEADRGGGQGASAGAVLLHAWTDALVPVGLTMWSHQRARARSRAGERASQRPRPGVLERSIDEVLEIATRLKGEHPEVARRLVEAVVAKG